MTNLQSLETSEIQQPTPEPDAVLINYDEGYILFDDDSEALIDLYIDAFGCETEEVDEAVALVGRFSKGPLVGKWCAIDLSQFERRNLEIS